MGNRIKILTVRFQNDLAFEEIPLFRGGVIKVVKDADVLFHNHIGDTYRYRYPLIQYKRINKKAVIVCLAEGADAFGEFFRNGNFNLQIGKRNAQMEISQISAHQELIQIWDSSFEYHLNKWLALNQANYNSYLEMDSIADKMLFLEKTLIANILSMAKTLGIYFEKQVNVAITEIGIPRSTVYKGVKLMTFDVRFKTNVSLPDNIGLGKGCSVGYGMIHRVHKD